MSEAVRVANAKVLLNPIQSPSVISSSNVIAEQVISFLDLLEIESSRASAEARQWKEAASEHWEKARVVGSQGITQAKKLSGDAREGAAALKGKLSGRIPGRKRSTQDDE